MFRGKKYKDNAKLIDRATQYEVPAAMDLVVKTASAKFDETVEVHIKLGVDSRHADQQVRGAIVLPNGTGKNVRVLVFAKGDKAEAAKAAGYEVIIIADHGNADHAINADGTPNTAHSLNPVPFVYISNNKNASVESGRLADVAPSILKIMGLPQPADMTGKCLIVD